MGIDWRQDDEHALNLYTEYNGIRYRLRQGEDERIRLSSDNNPCIYAWDDWETAKSDALTAILLGGVLDESGIKVERTGEFFSIAGSQYRATYPDGTTETFWSPPWHTMDHDEEDAKALEYAEKQWAARQATGARDG